LQLEPVAALKQFALRTLQLEPVAALKQLALRTLWLEPVGAVFAGCEAHQGLHG
jgi:hypothetical protein